MFVPPQQRVPFGLLAVFLCVLPAVGRAQVPGPSAAGIGQPPSCGRLDEILGSSGGSTGAVREDNHFRLFRMPAGFLKDPIGLQTDDDPPPTEAGLVGASDLTPGVEGDYRLQVTVGNDNPYFDFRPPGAPGGIGFYKLHAQYLVADHPTGGCCLELQAVTPAGMEVDGASSGPTVLSPTLAWYQALDDGGAVHGFVGKDVRANSRWSDSPERCVQYGLALQYPLGEGDTTGCHTLHWFIEALGRYRYDPDLNPHPLPSWELLPGLHWRAGPNWWVSGGVSVPVSSPRVGAGLWQLTCSWRF